MSFEPYKCLCLDSSNSKMLCMLNNYEIYATSRNLLSKSEFKNVNIFKKLCNLENSCKVTHISFVYDVECRESNSSELKLPLLKKFNCIQGIVGLANLACCEEFINFVHKHKTNLCSIDKNIILNLKTATDVFSKMSEFY